MILLLILLGNGCVRTVKRNPAHTLWFKSSNTWFLISFVWLLFQSNSVSSDHWMFRILQCNLQYLQRSFAHFVSNSDSLSLNDRHLLSHLVSDSDCDTSGITLSDTLPTYVPLSIVYTLLRLGIVYRNDPLWNNCNIPMSVYLFSGLSFHILRTGCLIYASEMSLLKKKRFHTCSLVRRVFDVMRF